MTGTKLSVCMATYNGQKYVRQQIETILLQLGSNDELIVSDDSSSDDTVSIVRSFHDRRIVVLEGNRYRSPILNFECALKHASGDYLFLADQDDLWHEHKIRTLLPLLRIYDLVVSDCDVIDEDDNIIVPSFFALRHSGPGILKNLLKNTYLGCCMSFKRSILQKALPFPVTIPMHDMWLGILAEWQGTTHFCSDKLISYRRHAENASPTGGRSCYSLLDKFDFRYRLISALIKRCYFDT